MDKLAPHLPKPTSSLISLLALASLLLTSDFSVELCSCLVQLLCTTSHLLSFENSCTQAQKCLSSFPTNKS